MRASQRFFPDTIKILLEQGDLLLASSSLIIDKEEQGQVVCFLNNSFEKEVLQHPSDCPAFDPKAALWAAELLYRGAILTVYRQQSVEEVLPYFQQYDGEINASAMISADLCLRFLPDVLKELQSIDHEDVIIASLNSILMKWPLSAVRSDMGNTDLESLQQLLRNACMKTMLVDKIVFSKNINWALIPELKQLINVALGLHRKDLWPEYHDRMKYE